jgi:hypothetical protein
MWLCSSPQPPKAPRLIPQHIDPRQTETMDRLVLEPHRQNKSKAHSGKKNKVIIHIYLQGKRIGKTVCK